MHRNHTQNRFKRNNQQRTSKHSLNLFNFKMHVQHIGKKLCGLRSIDGFCRIESPGLNHGFKTKPRGGCILHSALPDWASWFSQRQWRASGTAYPGTWIRNPGKTRWTIEPSRPPAEKQGSTNQNPRPEKWRPLVAAFGVSSPILLQPVSSQKTSGNWLFPPPKLDVPNSLVPLSFSFLFFCFFVVFSRFLWFSKPRHHYSLPTMKPSPVVGRASENILENDTQEDNTHKTLKWNVLKWESCFWQTNSKSQGMKVMLIRNNNMLTKTFSRIVQCNYTFSTTLWESYILR